MTEHPPRQWLTDFMLGRLDPDQNRLVIFHLLRGCPACKEEIAPLAEAMFRPGRGEVPPDTDNDNNDSYDDPVGRTFATILDWKRGRERERREGETKAAQLLCGRDLPEEPGFWTWGLAEVLLEKSWSLRHDNPGEMQRLADLARQAADRVNVDEHGSATFDLRARAWGEYANACRVADDLVEAERAIGQAMELRKKGTGTELIRARLAEVIAAIYCHQRKFPAAFRALDLARSIHMRHGQHQSAVRVLVQRGIYTGRSGDPEEGIKILGEAMRELGEEGDPKLNFLILHNLLLFRVENGNFRDANLQLFEMRPLYAQQAGEVDLVKLRWIEGRIAAGLGEFERAERAFRQVREEFAKRGKVHHGAVAGLDLASIWLRQGRTREVLDLVVEMLEVFRSRYVARESIAALLMLRDALERNRASLELLTVVAEVIEQHQDDAAKGNPQPAL